MLYEYRQIDTAKIGIHVINDKLLDGSESKPILKNWPTCQKHDISRTFPTVVHDSRKYNGPLQCALTPDRFNNALRLLTRTPRR